MPVVDIHGHIYPEKIATKAVGAIGHFYNVEMRYEGTAKNLLKLAEGSDVTHHVVHSVATSAKAVETINTFIAQECAQHPEFIGFATMHQDYADPEVEIERAMSLGLKGVKLHPDTQQVNLDDPRLMAVYEIIEGRLPVMLHVGDYRYDYSSPARLKKVLAAFPDLVVNAAHMGAWSLFDIGYDYLASERCFVDTSNSMVLVGARHMKELVHLYGASRVMFGSDFPMWDPVTELEHFLSLGFTDDELDLMLWRNAEAYLGSSVSP